jgi:AraC-like DNA-binding protein
MIYRGKNSEYLQLETINSTNSQILKDKIESSLIIIWITSDNTVLKIDDEEHTFSKNQIVSLTEFHQTEVVSISTANFIKFNRAFYCILHNDSEVGCKGLLFFGANQIPILNLPTNELEKFEILWKMFCIEMESQDDLQIEMLQMMLKRFLILCTRIHKEQNQLENTDLKSVDLLREFNLLVETHFKTIHTVSKYAELLNKSPKTISNIFSKTYDKTPLQYIQDRIMLEAKRLLTYTDKPIKEIGYELGFEDIQGFSRFFKNKQGISPSDFKEKTV